MSASAADAAVSMARIEKRFTGVHALKDVSIEIRPEEVVGLIGENGAGKSTLMKILVASIRPTPVRLSSRASRPISKTPLTPTEKASAWCSRSNPC